MKTVIYLDVLLGVNLLIAWCLLRATGGITSSPLRPIRLCTASILAALSTLTLLAPTMSVPLQIFTKLGGAVCIVAVAFPYNGPRMLLRRSLWYFLLNLIFAGVVLLAASFYQNGMIETNNLSVYFNISPQVLVCSVLVVWLVLKLAEIAFPPPCLSDIPVEMCLEFQDKKILLQAMADTGCHIQDPLTGYKVVLVSLQGAKEQLPAAVAQTATQYFLGKIPTHQNGMRLISCNTAAGKTILPAFSACKLTLKRGKHIAQSGTVTVAITQECFQPGQHPALVGADWLEQLV